MCSQRTRTFLEHSTRRTVSMTGSLNSSRIGWVLLGGTLLVLSLLLIWTSSASASLTGTLQNSYALLTSILSVPSAPWKADVVVRREAVEYLTLKYGMAAAATDGFDVGVDYEAPPPGPSSEHAGFFISDPDHTWLYKDMRALVADKTWQLQVTVPDSENWEIEFLLAGLAGDLNYTWQEADASWNGVGSVFRMDSDSQIPINNPAGPPLLLKKYILVRAASTVEFTMAVDPPAAGTTSPAVGSNTVSSFDTVVAISATPNAGYRFDHWEVSVGSPVVDPNASSTSVSIDIPEKVITAYFTKTWILTMAVSPGAGGTTVPSVAGSPHTYDDATVVDVSATANAGYRFDHWEDDLTGSVNPTTVTMDADKTVTAVFVKLWTLTMAVSPGAGGTTDPPVGAHIYDHGTVVPITATLAAGYRFDHWDGDVAVPGSASTSVTVDADKTVTAVFIKEWTLTMAVSPGAGGTTDPPVGAHIYDHGTVVPVTATPAAGYRFDHWDGDVAAPGSASTSVTVDADKTVTAVFVKEWTLTMAVSPAGGGTTTPAVGAHIYDEGTVVPVTATAAAGYVFHHWDGDVAAPGSASTTVTMNADKTVTAVFHEEFTLNLLQGWNLVSIAVEPDDPALSSVFPPANVDAVWEYNNPGGYAVPTEIHPKKGYWVKASTATSLTIVGVRPTDTSVSLSIGWNLVGVVGPSPAEPWQAVPPDPPINAVWEYLPPYHIPDPQCQEGRGFWMKASEATTIWSAP